MAKVVLVTGASSGIGEACAVRLAADGWTVVGASRRGTASPGWSGMVMDVDRDESVGAGVARLLDDHRRIDAVVLAAGWGIAGAVEHTPLDDARAQLETNFWGVVRVTQAVLPAMRAQGGGRIVVISSIGGVLGIPFQAFYSASKFALEGWGEALASASRAVVSVVRRSRFRGRARPGCSICAPDGGAARANIGQSVSRRSRR